MGSLRSAIQEKIEESAKPEEAAIAVCLVLENEIGLAGNGWFDDDERMQDVLRNR